MNPLNHSQIKRKTLVFWLYFLILIFLLFLPVYALFFSYNQQKSYITDDLNAYKEVLNRQIDIHHKVDSLHQLMGLLNTGKVGNDLFLEQYISNNKAELSKVVNKDSSEAFKHYALLLNQMDKMLLLKDSIRVISSRESLAYRDLIECINKSKKIKRDLSFDPARNFSTNK